MVALTREQLENRLAALHLASLELVTDISLDSLLQRIAFLACEQVNARYGAVGVLGENGSLDKFIPVGLPPEEIVRIAHPPVGSGLIGQLMRSTKPIRIDHIHGHPGSVGFPSGHPNMDRFLGVPIRLGNENLGQIYLTDKINGTPFTNEDEKVIQTLASYAAVAISNARLYLNLRGRDEALTRRNQDLALLNDLASMLASSLDTREILEKALLRVMEYPLIVVGEIFVSDEESKCLDLAHQAGQFGGYLWEKERFDLGEGPIGQTAQKGKPLFSNVRGRFGKYLKPEVKAGCLSQIACFPLSGRSGSQGVLCIATCQDKFLDEQEKQLFTAIGAWVGTAIENVHLFYQGRRLAILEERERIGMDLHDGVIQSIYAVGLNLEHARLLLSTEPAQSNHKIVQAIEDLNHTMRDIRAYILDLRPRQLFEENLIEGIHRLITEFKAHTLIEIELSGPEEGMSGLPQSHALALFHICQESLANIAKHARAHIVRITIWRSPERALLEIRDDGKGFDPAHTNVRLGHGLANMHTRARNVGGDVEISSEPGEGTTILAWVPTRNNH